MYENNRIRAAAFTLLHFALLRTFSTYLDCRRAKVNCIYLLEMFFFSFFHVIKSSVVRLVGTTSNGFGYKLLSTFYFIKPEEAKQQQNNLN